MPDMARYMAFLLGDPKRSAEFDLVLKRSSLEEMWRPQIAAGDDFTQGRMARTTQSGLSFFIDRGRGLRFVGHNGDQNGLGRISALNGPARRNMLALKTETRGVRNDARPRHADRGSRSRRAVRAAGRGGKGGRCKGKERLTAQFLPQSGERPRSAERGTARILSC